MAIIVTATIRSGTPKKAASALPLLTNRLRTGDNAQRAQQEHDDPAANFLPRRLNPIAVVLRFIALRTFSAMEIRKIAIRIRCRQGSASRIS